MFDIRHCYQQLQLVAYITALVAVASVSRCAHTERLPNQAYDK